MRLAVEVSASGRAGEIFLSDYRAKDLRGMNIGIIIGEYITDYRVQGLGGMNIGTNTGEYIRSQDLGLGRRGEEYRDND